MSKKNIYVLFVVVIIALTLLPTRVLAASLTSPATNLDASYDGTIGDITASAKTGEASMTVTSAGLWDTEGKITLTNSGQDAAQLSFTYSVTGTYKSFTIAGATASASGSYSAEIASGSSIEIYVKVGSHGLFGSQKGVTVSLGNIKLDVASSAKVTVSYNSLGTVKVDGAPIASGDVIQVAATGASFVASPVSGASFVGWIDAVNNSVVSTSASFSYVPTGDISLRAVFASASSEPCFWGSSKSYLFESLSAAISHASSASNKTIILAADGTLSSGSYIIPAGVTLLIPFESAGTCYTTSPGYEESSYTTPKAYSTLTMTNGANITVNGAISVSAKVSAKMGYAGAPTSSYGHIAMQSGSSITVNSEGNLYAWGYISGSGSVTIKSGATVYESFQVVDWRGGTASSGMLNNSSMVFPMSQYYVQNVEAPMTLEAGAAEKCSMVADIISVRQVVVPFVGSSGCMFNLTSGSVTKRYDGSADRILLDINGDLSVSNTTIPLIGTYNITVGNYVLPIGNNYSLNVNSGTLDFETSASLLAGSEINIAEGAKVTVTNGAKLFVYDETEWKSGVYIYSAGTNYHRPVRYAVGKNCTRTAANIVDAKILVNGTLDASAGYLYTTASGANIYSTGNGVVILQAADSSHTLYEAVQSGTSISYSSIPIVSAKLKDEDGEYFETSAGTYKFAHYTCTVHGDTAENSTNAKCGAWHAGDPKEEVSGPDATCTENGSKTYTCSCAHSYTVTINAFGHTEVTDDAVEPTCTATGLTEGCHCSVCNEVFTAQEVIDALGHKEVTDDAVAPTCTETGLTEGCHCSVCNEVFTAQEVIDALGHAWGDWVVDNNTHVCTSACGNDGEHTISVLLEYRLDSYIWLNATVTSTAGTPNYNGKTLQANKYIVQKVLSNQITDSVKVSFTLNGATPDLEIGFLAYSAMLKTGLEETDKLHKLLVAMENYGAAADKFFDGVGATPGTVKDPTSSVEIQKPAAGSEYDKTGVGSLVLNTTGATVFFDEALRLGVGYNFLGATVDQTNGTITVEGETYTVLQIGVLTQKLTSWSMGDVLYAEQKDGVQAYIVYNNAKSGATLTPGGSANKPNVGTNPDSSTFENKLAASGVITFDLDVKQYKIPFALRTYAVVTDGTNQYVVYGGQYVYGLETYVNNVFGTIDNDDETDDAAFDWLLSTVSAYADAAFEMYGG